MAFVINAHFDDTVTGTDAAGYKAAVAEAIKYFETYITTDETLNLTFSFNYKGLAQSDGQGDLYSFAQVSQALETVDSADNASDVQKAAAASLQHIIDSYGATLNAGGNDIWVTSAQAMALGLLAPADDGASDGQVWINDNQSWFWSQGDAKIASNANDAVSSIEHEISEVMGRVAEAGKSWIAGISHIYTPFDFYRYTAADKAATDPIGANAGAVAEPFVPGYNANTQTYFSYDGSTLTQALEIQANIANHSDVADWAETVPNDSYGYSPTGVVSPLSLSDLQVMQAIGYSVSANAVTPTVWIDGATPTDNADAPQTTVTGSVDVANVANKVTLYVDGAKVATAQPAASGAWSASFDALSDNAQHVIQVTAYNAVGFTSYTETDLFNTNGNFATGGLYIREIMTDAGVVDNAVLSGTANNMDYVYASGGLITLNGAQAELFGSDNTIDFSANAANSLRLGWNLYPETINGFVTAGQTIVFDALSNADILAVDGQTLTISGGGVSETLTFGAGVNVAAIKLTSDATTNLDTLTICFMAGTRIATPQGEVAVEELARGDLVLTAQGEARPVSWIGRQTVAARFADPLRRFPIRIMAGALAENSPSRDLLVSPDHALLVDGLLVHAGALVNGSSIRRETAVPEIFVYYHVELDDHSLILAENVAAETFVDNADRMNFDNWDEHLALYPQGRPISEMALPRAKARRQVPAALREALERRASRLFGPSIAAA